MLTLDINNPQEHCNLACDFCYSWSLEGQLSLPDIQRITEEHPTDKLIELGGGEPLLHPEIGVIIEYLTMEAEKNVHIATNGTHIPSSLPSLPRKARDRVHMQISLHASNSKLYGLITGKPSLFSHVVNNIPALSEYFQTSINTVAYKKNFEDIPNIVDLVRQYDLSHRINLVLPVGRGMETGLLSQWQIAGLTSYLLAEKVKGTDIDSPLLHANSCPALESAYGIPASPMCPAETGQKKYISATCMSGCEFIPKLVILKSNGEKNA